MAGHSRAPGLILLGYARSAGSGDQAVPGVVTSRRDRGQQQRQKDKRTAAAEEDRKRRERQEVAAQYLKRKWKEQDDKRKRKADRGSDGSDDEPDARPRHASDDGGAEEAVREEVPPEPEGGQWVSTEGNKRVLSGPVDMLTIAPPQAAGNSGHKEPERRGFLPGAPQGMSVNPAMQQKRKKALANAFGLDNDDDDGEARRELELAARIKRQRVDTRPGELSMPGASSSMPSPAPMSQFDQLRKLAEWKRKCKGNRVPMPDDLVAAIGGTAGLQHTQPQTTLGRDPVSAAREAQGLVRPPRQLSPSPPGGGSRQFAERRRSRSQKKKKRSRSKSKGNRSRGAGASTRAVL